jgi:hypothetical protein
MDAAAAGAVGIPFYLFSLSIGLFSFSIGLFSFLGWMRPAS